MGKKKSILKESDPEWFIKKKHADKLGLEDIKFIFSQAEKRLGQSIEVTTSLLSKTTSLLTTTSGVLLLVVGYTIKSFLASNYFCLFQLSVLLSLVITTYLLSIIYLLYKNLRSHLYYGLGSKPSESLNEYILHADFDSKDLRLRELYLIEIEDYEIRIAENSKKNDKRCDDHDTALTMLLLSPIVLLISSLILFWLY